MTKTLPSDFLRERRSLLGEEWDAFLQSYDAPRAYGLRRNPLKDCGELPFTLEPIPWTRDGFYFDPEERPGKHPLHEAGAYYIQEPSAMAVASLLDPRPGERICDLCAAPGGKSTQIAGILQGQGLLICNEIIPARAKILSQNIERLGITNALVCNEPPDRMAAHFPMFFHRIVVDAPCSGEGMFRKDDTAIREWSPENVASCAERQKMILEYADRMLQPGGVMVYSTCTFSLEENEGMMDWFLRAHPDYILADWRDTALGKHVSGYPEQAGFCGGIDMVSPQCTAALRLWPHKLKGEGHFMARLQKAGRPFPMPPEASAPYRTAANTKKGKKGAKHARSANTPALAEGVQGYREFIEKYFHGPNCENILSDRFALFGDALWQLPAGTPSLSGIRLIRAGLHVGTLKKNRWEPAHALAKALTPEQAKQTADCSMEDAIRYLKGETLSCDSSYKGWTLVCYQGCSLGWGKAQNGTLKNHFPKGLRRMG